MGHEYKHAKRILLTYMKLANNGVVKPKELQEKYGVSRKTIYNDFAAIQEAGLDLEHYTVDGEAHWMAKPEGTRKVRLELKNYHVLALGLAKSGLSFLKGTTLHDILGDIQTNLSKLVNPNTKKLLNELERKITIVPYGPKMYRSDDQEEDEQEEDDIEDEDSKKDASKEGVLNELVAGLQYNNRIKITYQAPGSGKKQHVLEPLTLVLYRESLYIVANILASGRRACFAVDRISECQRLRKNYFDYPKDHDPKDYFDGAFGLAGGEKQRIEIIFNEQQARYIRERQWHASQQFEDLPDGRVRMTMEASGMGDVLRWLIGNTGTFEVVSPPSLREEVQNHLRTGLELHGAKTKLGSKKRSKA